MQVSGVNPTDWKAPAGDAPAPRFRLESEGENGSFFRLILSGRVGIEPTTLG